MANFNSSKTLRTIKEAFDWEEYITDNYEHRHANGRHGPEYRICCPSCGEDKYKCYVNPDIKAFNCFKCDFNIGNYDLFHFVALTEGITRGQALLRLVREFTPTTPSSLPEDMLDPKETLPTANTTVSIRSIPPQAIPIKEALDKEDAFPFLTYLAARGFNANDILATNVHYVPDAVVPIYNDANNYKGNIGQRLLFPIYFNNRVAGWQARAIFGAQQPKYLNCPDSDVSKTFWPFSRPTNNEAILVEGIIDAQAVRKAADVSAYATFSKHLSDGQIELLKYWDVTRIILWWDKKDALKEMIRAIETLKMHFEEVYVLDMADWPKDKDTGYYLSDARGTDIIRDTLTKRIDVYNTLEYAKWTKSF